VHLLLGLSGRFFVDDALLEIGGAARSAVIAVPARERGDYADRIFFAAIENFAKAIAIAILGQPSTGQKE